MRLLLKIVKIMIKMMKLRMNLDVAKELGQRSLLVQTFLTYLLEGEPQSFEEAMSSSEAPLWKEAIQSEIDSIL